MKRLIFLLLLLVILAPVVLVALSIEPTPRVAHRTDATPEDARRANALQHKLRNALSEDGTQRLVVVQKREIDSAMRFAMRALPFLRTGVQLRPGAAELAISVALPDDHWSNLALQIHDSEDRVQLGAVSFGKVDLPGGALLPLAEMLLNLTLGEGMGTVAADTISGVRISPDTVELTVGLSADDKTRLATRAKDLVRSSAGLPTAAEVRRYWLAIDSAARTGALASSHSLVDYARFILRSAAESGDDMEAPLLALAIHCGHKRLEEALGKVLEPAERARASRCQRVTLLGRPDLRAHFSLSAGLEVLYHL